MRRITGSSLQRAMVCPASCSLPAIVEEVGDAAMLGTSIHAYLERVVKIGRKAALSAMPDDVRDACTAIDVGWIESLPGEKQAEIAFAYNAIVGDACALNTSGRQYPNGERGDVFCTVDLVVIGDQAMAIDYKTGRNRVTSCRENWQLRLSAIAVSRAMGVESIDMRIAYLNEDGSWDFDDYHADPMDLDLWVSELKRGYLMADAVGKAVEMGGIPDVYPTDDACRWCPCKQSCPAKTAALVQVQKAFNLATSEDVKSTISRIDASAAGEIWSKLSQIIPLVEAAKEAITERAALEPLPLPSGKILRTVETKRDYINGEIAFLVLSEKYGLELAEKICSRSVTKSSMRPLGRRLEEAIESIREAGGIDERVFQNLKECK